MSERHVMTFEEWKKRNPDIEEDTDECPECNGEGEHECDCGDLHECGFCDGTGVVGGKTLQEIFYDQYKRDMKALERWLEKVKL
jgi:DnaJ-class molecular chaperone